MWDELLPLSLINSNLFTEYLMDGYTLNVDPQKNIFPDIIISSVLNSEKPTAGVVFNEVPSSGFMLMLDVESIASELIAKHGYTEFKITSLTSEIHSHMGIYSILGAKTGLRIMEYLHAGLDEIEIVSYAGFEPPISCFNDGLQVGTGSTIGYGTISVDTTQGIKPAVLVKYNGRKILFSIKPELTTEIRNDVGKLIKDYGLESEMYWIKLRELSISKYWLGKSRFDILDIQELE
jgi:pyrimidine-specific ribonucleoside hydrolase